MSPESTAASRLRRFVARRPAAAVTALVAVPLAALLAAVAAVTVLTGGDDPADTPAGQWEHGVAATGPTGGATTPLPIPASEGPSETITMSAVGDIIMGDEGRLPADDGEGFFDGVRDALTADLVMGNLEEPLTGDTGHRKCGEDSTACHAFRAPPRYAAHLRDAGFDLLNMANNHGSDFGPAGRDNTRAALDQHGLAHTGARDQIAVVEAGTGTVAVVGFSPYTWTNQLNDHAQAADVVSRASEQADLVVVQVHMGAEGEDATHVQPGTETFYGENRGDPMAFSRAVIDAGADLVVGHGPHVLRGLEFYQGRLIAYSLGNFAGAGLLSAGGRLGLGAVLKVELTADGEYVGGELVSTHMYEAGLAQVDPQQRSLDLVREVTAQDFGDTGALLDEDGSIVPPEL